LWLYLLFWWNRIAAAFNVVVACGRERRVFLALTRIIAWSVVLWGKQTKVRQMLVEERRCRGELVVFMFMFLLLLLPWHSTEAYIEKLWSSMELGRH
jgi:hypothetical protein